MKTYLSIIFILLFSISFGQGKAESGVALREQGEYDQAISYYLKQKENGFWDWGNKYNYAKVLALAQQVDSCFSYLDQNINEQISVQTLTDVEFIRIKEDKRWAVYEQSVINKHLACKEVRSSAQIYRMIALYRKDDSNIKLLFDFINNNGWPKISQVGSASTSILAILEENEVFLKESKKHLKKLKQLCIEGEVNCQYFAQIYDLIQKQDNKPQKYGTIFDIDYNNNNKRIYYKFSNEKNVNKSRSEIGLEKLKYYNG
ncbi:hypothetical protein ACYSNM_09950 [Myroides sp. LJL116]